MNVSVMTEIVEQLKTLPDNLQQRVLEFIQILKASAQHEVSGKQLLRFAGTIPLDDLQRMHQAIEVGCEQVDLNEW